MSERPEPSLPVDRIPQRQAALAIVRPPREAISFSPGARWPLIPFYEAEATELLLKFRGVRLIVAVIGEWSTAEFSIVVFPGRQRGRKRGG